MTETTLAFQTRTYYWSGHDTEGQQQQGEIKAVSLNLASHYLQQRGIIPARIRQQRRWLLTRRPTLPARDLAVFYRQLATLITAGAPLAYSLQMLAQQASQPLLRTLIHTLRQTIEAGQPLSAGLRACQSIRDPLTCHMIVIAEETGTLETMLRRISQTLEERLTLLRQIRQALIYPALIVTAALIVTLTLLLFVVPRFADLFATMQAPLPWLTRLMLHIAQLTRQFGWLALLPVAGLPYGYHYYQRDPERRLRWQMQLAKLPWLGPFQHKRWLAHFTRTLSILLFAGIPITEALKLLADATENPRYQRALLQLQQQITQGMRLCQAIQQQPLFPPLVRQMVQVGEESGALDTLLAHLAGLYETEIRDDLKQFVNLLEPLIILLLGVLIGGLVIALYLPIFQLGTAL